MRVSCPQYIPTPSCRRSPTAPPQEIPWHSARPRIRTRYPLLNQDRHAPPHAAFPIGRLAIRRDEHLVDGRRGLPNRRREGRADLGYVNLGLTAEHATVDEKPSDSEVLKRTSSAQRKLLSNKDRSPERSLSISRNELDRNARCLPNSATFRHFEPAPLLNQGWNRPFAVEPGSEGPRPGGAAPWPDGGRRDPWARIDHHDNVAFGELILRRFRVSATWAYVERLPGSPARTARNGSKRAPKLSRTSIRAHDPRFPC